jgi:5-methylcytosine-specific restriction endonuclease McrA
MKRPKFTRDQLVAAIDGATSIRQVLIRLDVAPYGGNYGVLRRALHRYNIDTPQFTGRGWSRGKHLSPRKPLTAYLDNAAPIQSYKLKRRLLRERLFERCCAGCGLTHWQAVPIPLELDHINGNNQDNRLENLRLLCPNCHALTPTYRSKRRSELSSVLQPP